MQDGAGGHPHNSCPMGQTALGDAGSPPSAPEVFLRREVTEKENEAGCQLPFQFLQLFLKS